MGRRACCDKNKVKRGSWSPEEDDTLKTYINKHGTPTNWIAFPNKAGLQRCGKSCRLRWLNYLRPNIKHGGFTHDEEFIISNLFNQIGSRWSVIASHLPGRTDNDVKNYWNTRLKKKHVAELKKTAAAAAAATTSSQIVPMNIEALQDEYFPMPFVYDAPSLLLNEPINSSYNPSFNINLEEPGANNMNFPFSPSLQDSSQFSPNFWNEDSARVEMEEYSCGIWSKGEEADCNADLFSIFQS